MSISSRIYDLAQAVREKINEMMPRLIPTGGGAGQTLVKRSSDDFDLAWSDVATGQTIGGWMPVKAVGTGVLQVVTLPEDDLSTADIMVFIDGIFQHSGFTLVGDKFTTTQYVGAEIVIIPNGRRAKPLFKWKQPARLKTWVIPHNLNKNPVVTTVDSDGHLIIGTITYLDGNTVQVVFSTGQTGTAFLE
jgi:hypothetical protein